MVSPNPAEEQELRAVAVAVKTLPVAARPAWQAVWARVNGGAQPTTSRWPTLMGASMVATTLLLAFHFNLVGSFHPPTVAAQTVPGPQKILNLTTTQVAAQLQPASLSTASPPPNVVGTPAPVPLPPGGHS